MNKRLRMIAAILCVASYGIAAVSAGGKTKTTEELFERVPLPELPAHAAEIVRQTPAAERRQVAVTTVQTIVKQHPAAAVSVVAAVSKASPENADVIAAAAASIVPGNSDRIQSAAVAALDSKGKDKDDKDKNGNGNSNGNGGGNNGGNGNGNGDGSGTGKGSDNNPDKPGLGHGRGSVNRGPKDKPPTLPNGKPRPEPHEGGHHGKPSDNPGHYNRPGHG